MGDLVVVFGASGYIGGRLIPALLSAGYAVRAVSRRSDSLASHPWRSSVEVVEADLLDPSTLAAALEGATAAYYLVHSMDDDAFAERDRMAAQNMADAADGAGLEQIIYLGGLGDGDLSPHLASRQEVGRILTSGSVPVTELRAAVIIGSGSLSFEMVRYLTEVLPAMITPRWVRTRCQPIAVRDVLSYLVGVLGEASALGRVFEVGGSDVLGYDQMMQVYAEEAGLRRRLILPVPLLSLGLSARWVGLVTPLSADVARHLVESLQNEVIVSDDAIEAVVDLDPMGYAESIRLALDSTRGLSVPTRWTMAGWRPSDPLPTDPEYAFGRLLTDTRTLAIAAPVGDVAWAFMRVGGTTGYYASNWAWDIRGLLDQLFGGAGLRRGRRHPDEVHLGEAIDFWRVASIRPGRLLQLKAEMRLPGEAWLEWEVEPGDGGSVLTQTAYFAPRGVLGRLYWYGLIPFHATIFPRMIAGIGRAALDRKQSVVQPGRDQG
jgi:uncharacterized protein YbjT (DUF2867 family)